MALETPTSNSRAQTGPTINIRNDGNSTPNMASNNGNNPLLALFQNLMPNMGNNQATIEIEIIGDPSAGRNRVPNAANPNRNNPSPMITIETIPTARQITRRIN